MERTCVRSDRQLKRYTKRPLGRSLNDVLERTRVRSNCRSHHGPKEHPRFSTFIGKSVIPVGRTPSFFCKWSERAFALLKFVCRRNPLFMVPSLSPSVTITMVRRGEHVLSGLHSRSYLVSKAGRVLGRYVKRIYTEDESSFTALVCLRHHPFRQLLLFVLQSRQTTRTRRCLDHLDAAVRAGGVFPQWLKTGIARAFGLYALLRSTACPRLRQPHVLGDDYVTVPRALARVLARRGMRWWSERDVSNLHTRANEVYEQRYAAFNIQQMVVWVDNHNKSRCVVNPDIGYTVTNVTVYATLGMTRSIPPAPAWPRADHLPVRCRLVAMQHRGHYLTLKQWVDNFTQNFTDPSTIRAPLDKQRPPATRLPWRPYHMSDCPVQTQVGLLGTLGFLLQEQQRAGTTLPVLCDMNIHYRIVRMLYGEGWVEWDTGAAFQRIPPIYGLWHLYKYCVDRVWERFYPYMVYFQKGTVSDGSTHLASPKLRTMELLMVALLRVALPSRSILTSRRSWVSMVCNRMRQTLAQGPDRSTEGV